MSSRLSRNRPDAFVPLYIIIGLAFLLLWNGRFLASANVGPFDWTKETYTYAFLQQSLVEYHRIPLSLVPGPGLTSMGPAMLWSPSYWANPEVLTFSPLLALLPFVSCVTFLKIHALAHMCFGVIGMSVLSRRLGLDLLPGLVLFMLCFLHPWLMQHLALGYVPWVNACLAPMIVAMLISSPLRIRHLVAASALDALMIYQGGLHIFLWLNGAIALFSMVQALGRGSLRPLARAGLHLSASGLLCLPKLFATFSAYGGFRRLAQPSYTRLADLWGLLTDTHTPLFRLPDAYDVYGTNFYDGSLFVGTAYLLLLAASFGLFIRRWIRSDPTTPRPVASLHLLVVALAVAVIGWGGVWRAATQVIPVLGVERFPWRFLVVSLALLNVFLIRELFSWSGRARTRRALILLALAPVLVRFYQRNHLFVDVATSRRPAWTSVDLQARLTRTARAFAYSAAGQRLGELPVLPSLDRIQIQPPADPETKVLVSWLIAGTGTIEPARSFRFDNAEIAGNAGYRLLLRALDPARPIVITPRRYHLWPLALLSLLGYGLLVAILASRQRRRTRPPPADGDVG